MYEEALEIELTSRAIPFASQQPLSISYKEHILQSRYIVDIVYYGSVLGESKHSID